MVTRGTTSAGSFVALMDSVLVTGATAAGASVVGTGCEVTGDALSARGLELCAVLVTDATAAGASVEDAGGALRARINPAPAGLRTKSP